MQASLLYRWVFPEVSQPNPSSLCGLTALLLLEFPSQLLLVRLGLNRTEGKVAPESRTTVAEEEAEELGAGGGLLHGDSHLCSAGPSREWEFDGHLLLIELYFFMRLFKVCAHFLWQICLNFFFLHVLKKTFQGLPW